MIQNGNFGFNSSNKYSMMSQQRKDIFIDNRSRNMENLLKNSVENNAKISYESNANNFSRGIGAEILAQQNKMNIIYQKKTN